MYKVIILLCVIIILIIVYKINLGSIYYVKDYMEHYTEDNKVEIMKRPFLNLWYVDNNNNEILTNIVFITHPFTRNECYKEYINAKNKGIQFLGLSSYSEFPGPISNKYDILHDRNNDAWTKYDYFNLTRGWLSCFQEYNNKKWIKKDFPYILMSESQFANYEYHIPDDNIKKEYDFIYICLKDGEPIINNKGIKDCPIGWQSTIRSYQQAKILINIMCKKYNLKGLLIGRINCEIPSNCHNLLTLTDFLQYYDFIKQYQKCRFIFLPNYAEAAARCQTEAMCYNLPMLVNKDILGGWNFVNDNTGEFIDINNIQSFENTLDIFINKLNNNHYKPRKWFIENYGKYHSGKKLKYFIQSIFNENELNFKFNNVQYMKPAI